MGIVQKVTRLAIMLGVCMHVSFPAMTAVVEPPFLPLKAR